MSEEKAEEIFARAEKLSTKWNWFGVTRQANQEDAADLFKQAATIFKRASSYERAGLSYEKAASCSLGAESELDAMTYFKDSGSCYAHVNPDLAARSYRQAIDFYLSNDRFQAAAKLHEELAGVFEEDGRVEEAIAELDECINLFETEHQDSMANKRRLKVAHLAGSIGQYARAVELFERVARLSLPVDALRWSVKNYLFDAYLCVICDKGARAPMEMRDKLEEYKGMTDLFVQSRECTCCERLCEAMISSDEDAYRDAVQWYKDISPFKDWQIALLHTGQQMIRTKLNAPPDLDGGADDDAPAYTSAMAGGVAAEPVNDAPLDANAPDL